jgi:hypothetical protein
VAGHDGERHNAAATELGVVELWGGGGLEEKEAERWPEAAVDHGRALTCASDESRIN